MLPSGWATNTDEEGRIYYYNASEGITQWERPAEVIGLSKTAGGVPDFTSLSTGTPSFLAGNVDLEAGITTSSTTPPSVSDPSITSLQEVRSQAMKYFDVTTDDILQRLMSASLPYRMMDPQIKQIAEKPDLYGPFWICVTITFALFAGSHAYTWASDALTKTDYVTFYVASSVVFAFWSVLPVVTRLIAVWNSVEPQLFQLAHLYCVYGYSLWPIVPMCLLCTIPSKFLQMLFVTAAMALSLSFIALNFLEQFNQLNPRMKVMIAGTVTGAQVVLFMLFPIYFFHLPAGFHPPSVEVVPTPGMVVPMLSLKGGAAVPHIGGGGGGGGSGHAHPSVVHPQ